MDCTASANAEFGISVTGYAVNGVITQVLGIMIFYAVETMETIGDDIIPDMNAIVLILVDCGNTIFAAAYDRVVEDVTGGVGAVVYPITAADNDTAGDIEPTEKRAD